MTPSFRGTFRFSSSNFILAFCFAGFSFLGQQAKIDSLGKLLKSDENDSLKVRHLNEIAWCQKNISLFKESLENSYRALELGEKINFRKGVADAYNLIGVVYMEQGEVKKSLENYFSALEIKIEIKDKKGQAAVYNNIALVYESMGNFAKALENFDEAVKLNKETGNKTWLANNYNNIGNMYADKKNPDAALENYLTAKKIKEDVKETKDRQYANIVNNIGVVHYDKRDFDKALQIFENILKIRLEINDKVGVASSYVSIGSIYFEQMKSEADSVKRGLLYAKTHEAFSKARQLEEEMGDVFGLGLVYLNTGSLYLRMKKTDLARRELLSGISLFKETYSRDYTKDAYQLLAQCDSIDGDWKSAFENQKLFKQYNDSVFNEENSKKLAEMSTRFETEKKESQILQLEKEKSQTRVYIAIFGVLGISVLVLGRRAYNIKKKIAEFMGAESERKEIVIQEVHHRINNNLQIISSLLMLQANSADDEKLQGYLKQSQNRIQSLSSLHELLYQTDSTLMVNMVEYFDKLLDFHKEVLKTLPCKVELLTEVANADFTTRISVPLALILNELVTNSIKYAFAGEAEGYIKISLQQAEKDSGKWLLRVSDSGKGLPEDQAYRKNSLGLRLVNIMTKQIKGKLNTSNSPGATFEIEFNLAA